MMLPSVAVLSFSPIARDRRVLRQCALLAAMGHAPWVIGYARAGDAIPYPFLQWPVPRPTTLHRLSTVARQLPAWAGLRAARLGFWAEARHRWALARLRDCAPKLVLANDWPALVVAARYKREVPATRLLYDTHEFSTLEFDERRWWRVVYKPFAVAHEGADIGLADAVITVGPLLAEALGAHYRMARTPGVVRNIPDRIALPEAEPPHWPLRVLYHGQVLPDRGIEALIDAMPAWEVAHHVTIRGDGPEGYVAGLRHGRAGAGAGACAPRGAPRPRAVPRLRRRHPRPARGRGRLSAAMTGRPLRVLHAPWNVAGQSAQLAAAERALGAESRCVVLAETGRGFPADECLTAPGGGLVQMEIARWRLLWRAMRWADVVHFSFGQSCLVPNAWPGFAGVRLHPAALLRRAYARLVWLKDLPLLRAMGKTIAVTWQGDDARQRGRSLELFGTSIAQEANEAYYPPGSDAWKRRTIAGFARHAPLHYALNPDLLHLLPERARFLPYASFDPASVTPRPPGGEAPLLFAHAPSHRGAKGTRHVLAAAETLRAEGHAFQLDLIEGLPRAEALARYAACDVVVDQLLAGWYGGLAVEAMALAKPVLAFLRAGDLGLVPPDFAAALPVLSAGPAEIADAMRRLLLMPRAELRALGLRGRAFVEHWHDPKRVAARTLADYAMARGEG